MKHKMRYIGAGLVGSCVIAMGLVVTHNSASAADGSCVAHGQVSAASARAIEAACAEFNKKTPYSWGGGHGGQPGATTGSIYGDEPGESGGYYDDRNLVGYDCSGLMRWAWFKATGVDYGAGGTSQQGGAMTSHGFTALPNPGDAGSYQPGDVIVWRGHTAMVLGDGMMVQAEGDDADLTVKPISSHGGTPTGVYRYNGDGGTPPPPPQDPGEGKPLSIWASNVAVRTDSNNGSAQVGTTGPGTFGFTCQKRGENVSADGYSNDLWSYSKKLGGFVNNVFMKGEADYGLPACGGDAPKPPAPSDPGKSLDIWATDVNVRTDATSASGKVRTIQPSSATFTCQKRGEMVNDSGYSNDLWSFSPQLGGYVNNVFMKGDADYALKAC
ncbi:NlpC/P60 family protein [Luteipulveratus mongoliensis]|uniref:NlpC/P60 domain-containing protein n=1 Tax=Luteipulveratus mongoliensis TaxID=571913 RepID=A0A0K1JI34_9MICO|nr:NlpC/P60 family protein [Luteipulveratus mongoliensis]AKU16382.1 hypothetical protein VV02_11750 [Luteipulveratus mongoliensis]